jgi:lipopolysaccharide/colanic/teichoic acid biosynthesis glycosyltransferase
VLIRWFDILFASLGLVLGLPVLVVLWLIGLWDTGSPIFCQQRVGRHQQPFVLLKFRSMRPDTASVATHLADAAAITHFGRFMRRTKLDELPQLWNVLRGEMSLVGPRPCLFNQEELIAERAARGVFHARPGITGLAQIRGIDMSTPVLLAETDAKMLRSLSVAAYFTYIVKTITGAGHGDRIRSK